MLNTPGLPDRGLLLAVGEGGDNRRGLALATSGAAGWTESLSVRQTIGVERHDLQPSRVPRDSMAFGVGF